MGSKKKAQPGTWITRKMARSKAFWALNSSAKGLLIQFLLKRDMSREHDCLNRRNITLTYKELENLHGSNPDGTPSGVARTSIVRGITDLMAKGFIGIVRQGGGYQKDKTVYELTNDWEWWIPGSVVNRKEKGRGAGAFALKKSQPPN